MHSLGPTRESPIRTSEKPPHQGTGAVQGGDHVQRSRERPRADPATGEVPAGPGDAGLQGRPELNAGSPGTQQMSNRRLGTGLGVAALLGALFVIAMILA